MLYIVATPIGNLEDITLRALRILKEVDYIFCEDTRVTKKLLARYQIDKPLISYHQHSKLAKVDFIINLLKDGKNLALVSDSGTPSISDPGGQLVRQVAEQLGARAQIVPIPGPSAVITALSVSGLIADKFVFLGFPPHKKGRQKFFQEVATNKNTVVFYESPHRIIKALNELKIINNELKVVVARELTKTFETIYRGTIVEALEQIKQQPIKGEFVVIISR